MKRLAMFLACVVTFTGLSSNVPARAKVKSGTWWAIGIIAVGVGVYEYTRHHHKDHSTTATSTTGAGATMGTSGTTTTTPATPSSYLLPGTSSSTEMTMDTNLRLTPSTSTTVQTARDRAIGTPMAYRLTYTPVSAQRPAPHPLARLSSF